jgi:hypothetical protein
MTWPFDDFGNSTRLVFAAVIALVGLLGLLAMVSPKGFARLSQAGGHWVDTSRLISKLDSRYDVDRRVLSHSRLFGLVVLLAAVVLGFLLLG